MHRIQSGAREIAGAILTISTKGGYSVTHQGDYLGYLHASVSDQFNVYRRRIDSDDEWLGVLHVEDGVRAILRAAGRSSGTVPDDPLRRGAERVADRLSSAGYAFIEDDRIEALAAALHEFLATAGIPTCHGELRRRVTVPPP